ncbi:condensation domain-containing protein [Zobellia nedashkovskayae]
MSDQKDTFLALTKSQSALWAGQKMHPYVPLHNVVYTFEITGTIDKVIFEKAFQRLIETTDMLRFVFSEEKEFQIRLFSIKSIFHWNLSI